MSALLTLDERARVRRHLGYPNVAPVPALVAGTVRPIQTLFLVESAMDHLLPEAIDRIRLLLNHLDETECKLFAAEDYLVAAKMGELELRDNHPDLLEKEYVRWACRLADELAVPLYPYSSRFRRVLGGGVTNIKVTG